MSKKYRSDAMAAMHETMSALHFDDACLTPIRSLVSKWERGEKRPSGASLKLLSLVEKNGLAAVA